MAQHIERKSQTAWDAERAEAKAKAAVTIEENRVAALAARDAALKGDVVEAPDEEQGYADYKVAELKGFLSERGLEVSGTKDELIARLEESDAE